MTENQIARLTQRADKVQLDSRAVMLVEFTNDGEIKIYTDGTSMGIFHMKRNLKKLLEGE